MAPPAAVSEEADDAPYIVVELPANIITTFVYPDLIKCIAISSAMIFMDHGMDGFGFFFLRSPILESPRYAASVLDKDLTPLGGLTGVLVAGNPGWGWVFRLARVVTCTPQKYAQSIQLVERNAMAFSVFGFSKIL